MPLSRQQQRQRVAALLAAPTKATPDAKALLDAANSASQDVAVLHIAFMAVCAYVLVIVFGTTDLDLLMSGDNVKLPVVDVAVPVVGFYAAAPYLVVLVHLNLLLQLQLLSRKLFAFAAVTPDEEGVEGLRDRLHIFPYTYFLLVGQRLDVVVRSLLGLVVSVTLIVLPLATLLALQLKFLAYQAEGITWAQRIAVFLDVALLVALWPVILHPRDDWKAWWCETLDAHLLRTRKQVWLAVIVLLASMLLVLFAATPGIFSIGLFLGAVAPLLLIVLYGDFPDERARSAIKLIAVLWILMLWVLTRDSADRLPAIQPVIPVMLFLGALPLVFFWHPTAPRGSLALLSALVVVPLLTLGLMVDGEDWEATTVERQKWMSNWWQTPARQDHNQGDCMSIGHTVLSCRFLAEQRSLDLHEQALFAKPPSPQLLAKLRAGKGLENKDELERISLENRNLRRAQMESVLLVGANLRQVQLQGADLSFAQLPGADLSRAQLQGATLAGAQLQDADFRGAKLMDAQLPGVDLMKAQLQDADFRGADLSGAQFQSADLRGAQFQSANLSGAQFQGANLLGAQLQDVDLSEAQLQGADLSEARLEGTDLRNSKLYQNGNPKQSDLLDIRGTVVTPLSQKEFSEIQATLKSIPFAGQEDSLQRLDAAAKPGATAPMFDSCLADGKSQPKCQQTYDITHPEQRDEFMVRLHGALATLACEDPHTARGILAQIPGRFDQDQDSSRAGLATVLLARIKANEPCPGLTGLSAEDKTKLEELAKEEAEREQKANAARAGRR